MLFNLENLIRGLDDDEINFLDIVDKAKLDAEKKLQKQDDSELSEFRERVASLQEQTIDKVSNFQLHSVLFCFHPRFWAFFFLCRKSIQKRPL